MILQQDEKKQSGEHRPRRRLRRRILRSTSMLPALFTVSNGLLGFAAIHMATRPVTTLNEQMYNLAFACWLVFAAMVCDMLDGRVARMTQKTSDFGGQLDSLSDAISFGVAPAVISLRASLMALQGLGEGLKIPTEWSYIPVGRAIWCVAGAYVACAILRLARFNVENEPDESAHMNFAGLPSPGAAATVLTLVLLFTHVVDMGWADASWVMPAASIVLPSVTLICALLMVSRFKYPHPINQYLRGKKPFSSIVKMVILILAAVLEVFVTAAVIGIGYALLGPVSAGWRRLFGAKNQS